MSLYDDLGIKKDAKPDAIKRAYRKKAAQTHPDRPGGDKEAFQQVNRAYATLSDHSRRADYDATGETDERPNTKLDNIAKMVLAAIDNIGSIEHEDLIGLVKDGIKQWLAHGARILKDLDATIDKRERAKNRVIKKQGENIIAQMIAADIAKQQQKRKQVEAELEEGREMLRFLDEYRYRQSVTTMNPTSTFVHFNVHR